MSKFSVIVAAILLTAIVSSDFGQAVDSSCSQQVCLNGGTLVVQDHSYFCDCASPYFGSRCEQQCIIRLISWGLEDDPSRTTIASGDDKLYTADPNGTITVNGKTIVNTYIADNAARWAGSTIFCASLSSQNCSVIEITTKINPLAAAADGQKFVNFLRTQPNGSFLLCATANEPQTNLATLYSDIRNITGADLTGLDYRGKFAFIVEKGNPQNGVWSKTAVRGPHLYLNAGISGNNTVVRI